MSFTSNMNLNLQRNINFLSAEEESKFENNKAVIDEYSKRESIHFLGIYSEKSAALLNEVINWRISICKFKPGIRYPEVDFLKGGGLL